MKRRAFLASTAKAGAGAALAISSAAGARAASQEARRVRLWYGSHCYCCGIGYAPEYLDSLDKPPRYLLCEFCKWHIVPTAEGDVTMPVPPDWRPT